MTARLESERLVLRLPEAGDLDEWAEMARDPELTRYVGGPQPRSLVWRTIATMRGSWAMQGFGLFSIIERGSGRWLGCAGPWRPPDWPVNEVGWRLAPWALGRGFATEAARLACAWSFESLGWSEIVHPIHHDNAPSIRVARRLGATFVGPLKMPAPFDAMPIEGWRQRAPGRRGD